MRCLCKPERVARWKVIATGLEPQLDARHEALKAEAPEINRTRDELATRGDELRNRLAAALKTVHGFNSEKLIEYGI